MRRSTLHERPEVIRGVKAIRLKSGRLLGFWNAMSDIENAHTDLGRAISRAFKLADDDWDLDRLEGRLDQLEEHIGAVRAYLVKLRGVQDTRERIALLRRTEGRTPEEADAYLAKADELERGLS